MKVFSIVGISSSLTIAGASLRISDVGRARILYKDILERANVTIDQITARDPVIGQYVYHPFCWDQMKIAICFLSITCSRGMNPFLIEGYAEKATRKSAKARVGNESDGINNLLKN